MIIHENIEQRSPEWHQLRLGRITGTRIAEMAAGKPATFENLCRKVAAEIITGVSADKPFQTTDAMQHGIDTEDDARTEYEIETMTHVKQVGFVSYGDLFGVSPDGLIGDHGLVEIKCPQANTHVGYLLKAGSAWRAYRWQIMGQLWVTGRDWCDFVSYCPQFPEDQKLIIERVVSNQEDINTIKVKAINAEVRINEILDELGVVR